MKADLNSTLGRHPPDRSEMGEDEQQHENRSYACRERRRVVRFSCSVPWAGSVFLVGNFNNWDPRATPMMKDADGKWSVDVELSSGYYECAFIVVGQWFRDPQTGDEGGVVPDRGYREYSASICVNRFRLCHAGP